MEKYVRGTFTKQGKKVVAILISDIIFDNLDLRAKKIATNKEEHY